MKKYKATATFTTYGEIVIEAESEEAAFQIADNLDGDEFNEILGSGGWDIDIKPAL